MQMVRHQYICAQPCALIGASLAEFDQTRVNSGIIQQRATFVRARGHEIDRHALKIELESSEAIRHV
jgi:hypothetical protein